MQPYFEVTDHRDHESMIQGIREAHGEIPKMKPTIANPQIVLKPAESIWTWAKRPRCTSCNWPHPDKQPRCEWCVAHDAFALTNMRGKR